MSGPSNSAGISAESNGNGQQRNMDEGDAWGTYPSNSSSRHVARMPAYRNAEYYNMTHRHRGIALILNHEFFDISSLKPRTGTNVDADNLNKVLKSLGFTVTVRNNPTLREINRIINDIADIDHTNNDCVLVAVLTHGEHGILYAKDVAYKPENLWYPFTADRCLTLAGKPKMFFIQACQGDKLDGGVTLADITETDGSSKDPYRIPVHADFLIVASTVPGYFSWRNTSRGSWFMQALCDAFRHQGTQRDMLTLLTFVAQAVACNFESNTPDSPMMHQQKQVPCITSMLTRLILFTEKKN